MLEQMLKKLFENDRKAASGSGSERIKANVLSRIESEKPMRKHFGIKPLIVAAAVTAVGLMSVVLTVSASNEPSASEISAVALWDDQLKEQMLDMYDGDETAVKRAEEHFRRYDIATEFYRGKMAAAQSSGEITIEKQLDDTDAVGYAEPYRVFTLGGKYDEEETERQLELIKQLEEDPGALGLVPIGKSETFEGGLRIVNRHFENTNESTDKGKNYYSLRRVYTDDAENSLIASLYLGCRINFPEDENVNEPFVIHRSGENQETILDLFLDHTEEGCLFDFDSESSRYFNPQGSISGSRIYGYDGKAIYSLYFTDYDLKSVSDEETVTVGVTIAVTNDGIQWLD